MLTATVTATTMEDTVGRGGGISISVMINMYLQRDHNHDPIQNINGFSRHSKC